jgi:hypothetical protein
LFLQFGLGERVLLFLGMKLFFVSFLGRLSWDLENMLGYKVFYGDVL